MPFDGITYDRDEDFLRLKTMLEKVRYVMRGGRRWTLRELQAICGGSEAGISARIRDLRKEKFGGHTIERGRRGDPKQGIWEYWMVPKEAKQGSFF